MKKVFYILLGALIASCSKDPALWETQNLNGNKVSAFGHASMGIFFKYPVDSYESFEPCMRIGGDGTEMDVQMTKDSLLVLFHDQKLQDGTLCSGIINEKDWSEIKNCLHASPYSNSVNMITADFLISRIEPDKIITFDCKLYNALGEDREHFLETYASAIIKLADAYNLRQRLFIESSDTIFLRILKTRDPALKLFIYPGNFESALTVANKMDLYGITIDNAKITKDQVKLAHEHNRHVTVWNVESDNANIKAVEKNVDYIQSDKIIHLLKMFDRYKKQGVKNFKW